MKYVYCFLALIIGLGNFESAWVAPVEYFWPSVTLSAVIFASSFGQLAFNKPGDESAVVMLQLASMAFLMLGLGNLAMIS